MRKRRPNSHKGENGQVAIIGGGPTIHGAPLFATLAAEASGVDLLFVSLPKIHAEVAKSTSLNFQVHPFAGNAFQKKDCSLLLELLASVDCAVIGPGITEGTTHLLALLKQAPCPLVLDAGALQAGTLKAVKGKTSVLTPHHGELKRLGIKESELESVAKKHGVTIFLKGPVDHIAGPKQKVQKLEGGNAGLTVGGTGDALAGLIGGLIALGAPPFDACVLAGTIMKKAGAELLKEKGYAFTTRDVIQLIPRLLAQYDR